MLSTLYVDLVRGLREHREAQKQKDDTETKAALRREYALMLRAVLADGLVHPLEKAMLRDYANKHAVEHEEHLALLQEMNWTEAEWDKGVKANLKEAKLQQHLSGQPPPPIERREEVMPVLESAVHQPTQRNSSPQA